MNHLLNHSPEVLQMTMRTMFRQPCLVFLKKNVPISFLGLQNLSSLIGTTLVSKVLLLMSTVL